MRKCDTCRFVSEYGSGKDRHFVCRRYPPVVTAMGVFKATWGQPAVTEYDHCGEWKPKEPRP